MLDAFDAPAGDRPPLLRTALLALGVGTLVALVFAAQHALLAAAEGERFALEDLVRTVLSWWTWLPFVPLVWGLARRYPVERPVWGRRLALHAGAALVVLLAMDVLYVFVQQGVDVLFGKPAAPFGDVFRRFLLNASAFDLLTYAGLVMAGQMTAARREARARQAALERAERERLRAQARLSQAELTALRAHLNPHFLFNTLHAVSALMREDPARAEEALERLSELLRYALRLDRERCDLVRLADEADFVRHHLALEALRFGPRLRTVLHFDPAACDALVPPFTLQPLVENAVKHAVGPRREGAALTVTAVLDEEEETLHLRVCDDGPGADAARAAASPGLGLRAVRQRAEARFGPRAVVAVRTAPGEGFDVTVTLPAVFSLRADRPAAHAEAAEARYA